MFLLFKLLVMIVPNLPFVPLINNFQLIRPIYNYALGFVNYLKIFDNKNKRKVYDSF